MTVEVARFNAWERWSRGRVDSDEATPCLRRLDSRVVLRLLGQQLLVCVLSNEPAHGLLVQQV